MSTVRRAVTRPARQENYEHVLMCLICRSLFDDHDHQPKFLPCHHTFCKECLREYVRQMGDDIECPSCRKVATVPAAGVAALQTNFYAKYIQSLVYGYGGLGALGGLGGGPGDRRSCAETRDCESHPRCPIEYYCRDCTATKCRVCVGEAGVVEAGEEGGERGKCAGHCYVSITAATEQFHQSIDASFADANALIERKKVDVETLLKTLSEEKDQALLKIDATFESHVHVLSRRATLLKNNVIDVYNEHVAALESDLEEISTAMTCVVSLKEYHETMISHGDFDDADKGIEEIDEVHANIRDRIQPSVNHIVFFEKHGADKFRACATDLGRVVCNRTGSNISAPRGVGSISPSASASDPAPQRPSSSYSSHPTTPLEDGESIGNPCTTDVVEDGVASVAAVGSPQGSIGVNQNGNNDRSCISSISSFHTPDTRSASLDRRDANSVVNNNFVQRNSATPSTVIGQTTPLRRADGKATSLTGRPPSFVMQTSYDEVKLRRELGGGGGGVEGACDPSRRLSRSEFWATLSPCGAGGGGVGGGGSSLECSAVGDRRGDTMVAELSGEQTSL